ncbi:MAG: hypothetical protein JXR37_13525 [Kiritimatiellae bacterium]|nr:hypothetical protein [Kiritimatiellia bacterium]
MHRTSVWLMAVVLLAACRGVRAAPAFVWWEGEEPSETNFPKDSPFAARTFQQKRAAVLAGGDWLTNAGKRQPGEPEAFVRYAIRVPADGTYRFWVRKFWKHGPFRWRFDAGAWQECGRGIALADSIEIRKHLCANWVYLGELSLSAGGHAFELRLLAAEGENKTACFDCFLLTPGAFLPRGKLKPGEKSGNAEPGFFAWEPGPDAFGAEALTDLRHLNENTAGERGFVRREGLDLVLGDGRPVRFWMVQGTSLLAMQRPEVDRWARRLAKYGVNLVRLDAGIQGKSADDPKAVSAEKLDRIHYAVAALKKQGIYVYLGHVFWSNTFKLRASHGFPGYGDGQPCHGLLFLSGKMQEIYRAWVRALMSARNPHTGIPLAQDAAVAVFEIQNEDSLLFWTLNPSRLPGPTRDLLERQFTAWTVKRHGSIEAALAAWDGFTLKQDDPAAGRLAALEPYWLTEKGLKQEPKRRKRAGDYLRFLVETQRRFYAETVEFLRRELGMKQPVACSNWKGADERLHDALERYTYTAGDVLCRNAYFGVRYEPKPKRFYAVDVGDSYRERSALLAPENLPIQLNQIDAYPHMLTENNWDRPNRFRSEGPFLVAAYGALGGIDGWNWFALSGSDWDSAMNVWAVNTPSILGQFPAAALMFRRGDVPEAGTVIYDVLKLNEQYAFKGSAIRGASGLDELWQKQVGADGISEVQSPGVLDPFAFYVGRVVRGFTDDASRGRVVDLARYLDRDRGIVRSVAGGLVWDYGKGFVRLDTPRAQGLCGFLREAGRVELADVAIESGLEYGVIVAVSLDGQPLASSRRILIQAGSEDHTCGFKTRQENGRKTITELGGYPLNVRKIDATVTLKSAGSRRRVLILDENGYPTERRADASLTGASLGIRLPEDALYTVVAE